MDAPTRLQMVTEKARMTVRKISAPSLLERAVQEWTAQQKQRETCPFERAAESSVLALQQVSLQARPNGRRSDADIGWRTCYAAVERQPRRLQLNGATMGRIVQTVRAREWARATRGKTGAPRGSDLEAWAERWKRAEPARAEGTTWSRNSRGR